MKVRIKTVEEMMPDIDIKDQDTDIHFLKKWGFQLKDGSIFSNEMVKYCNRHINIKQCLPSHILGVKDIYTHTMGDGANPYYLSPLMYEIPMNRNGANS